MLLWGIETKLSKTFNCRGKSGFGKNYSAFPGGRAFSIVSRPWRKSWMCEIWYYLIAWLSTEACFRRDMNYEITLLLSLSKVHRAKISKSVASVTHVKWVYLYMIIWLKFSTARNWVYMSWGGVCLYHQGKRGSCNIDVNFKAEVMVMPKVAPDKRWYYFSVYIDTRI